MTLNSKGFIDMIEELAQLIGVSLDRDPEQIV